MQSHHWPETWNILSLAMIAWGLYLPMSSTHSSHNSVGGKNVCGQKRQKRLISVCWAEGEGVLRLWTALELEALRLKNPSLPASANPTGWAEQRTVHVSGYKEGQERLGPGKVLPRHMDSRSSQKAIPNSHASESRRQGHAGSSAGNLALKWNLIPQILQSKQVGFPSKLLLKAGMDKKREVTLVKTSFSLKIKMENI